MFLVLLTTFFLQSGEILIENLDKNSVEVRYVKLESNQKVRLKIIAAAVNHSTNSESYSWILDSRTREVVWQLDEASYTSKDKKLLTFYDAPTLPAGVYEFHFSTVAMKREFHTSEFDLLTLIRDRNHISASDFKRMSAFMTFENGIELSKKHAADYQFGEENEIVYTKNVTANYFTQQVAFTVLEPCSVTIYSVGEFSPSEVFDYAWLRDVNKNSMPWKMTYKKSFHAGGALKNRYEFKTLWLEKGAYILSYATDDSHSGDNWNDAIPFDPLKYGISLFVAGEDVEKIDQTEVDELNVSEDVVKLTRLRNNAFKCEGIRTEKNTELRVYAIGEANREREMLDYSWIEELKSGNVVWEMTYTNTRPAGGNARNRIFDDVIHLPKGDYVAYTATNSEHAYNNWMEERPYDDKSWGLTIYKQTGAAVESFDVDETRTYLTRLTEFPSSHKDDDTFTLNKQTTVTIYAIGEGSRGELLDFGLIRKSDEKRIRWRMKYENTRHAGGASRNRMFKGELTLERGTYIVQFKSNRSHAFGDWADEPPKDQSAYGITVYIQN